MSAWSVLPRRHSMPPRRTCERSSRAKPHCSSLRSTPPPLPPLVSLPLRIDDDDGTTLTVIKPICSSSAYDFYVAHGFDDCDPFWADVWPASVALVRHLFSVSCDFIRDARVAELGCGLGVAGVAAAVRAKGRARCVALLDYEAHALSCAIATAQASGAQVGSSDAAPSLDDGGATGVAAYEFDWTAPLPALEAPFDVVLASDVLYDKTQVPLIANVVCSLLGVNEHPSTGGTRRLLLADRASGTARTPFVEKLKESGAAVVVRPFDSPLVVADDSASDVVLVEATWNL